MKVGFFYMWCPGSQAETRYARAPATIHAEMGAEAVKAVRRVMPDVHIVHLTDMATPPLQGVDQIVRRPIPYHQLCFGRLDHYAELEGDWLYLDTDVIVQRDVRHVFTDPFDLAVADRVGMKEPDPRIADLMPYNAGVIFSRSTEFWRAAGLLLRQLKPERHAWLGDQRAMNRVIQEQPTFTIKVLPGLEYNYVPERFDEDLSGKFLIHYKGKRKAYILKDSYAIAPGVGGGVLGLR